jgi:hypothetical protein
MLPNRKGQALTYAGCTVAIMTVIAGMYMYGRKDFGKNPFDVPP